MTLLKKLRSFAVLVFVCSFLMATSLTSCENKSNAAEDETTEHPATEEGEKAEHPEGETEHPKSDSDSTKVEEPKK